jgi:hypothetical protein
MLRFALATMLASVCPHFLCLGQTSPGPDSESTGETARLPRWLHLGAELRARTDFAADDGQTARTALFLNRLRLNISVEPTNWFRLYFQGQDAEAFSPVSGQGTEALRNRADIRLGYAELGRSEVGWTARLGRQELSIGDERLVAADNEWDTLGQSFDAVSLDWRRAEFHLWTFTGFRVEPRRRRPDPFDTASRISGVTFAWDRGGSGLVQPYLLWKRGGETFDLQGHAGHRDVAVPGLLVHGVLPAAFDYSVEVAMERGHVADEPMRAWAGHWEIGWRPFGSGTGVRIDAEYNHASGDRDCADGQHGTFDDLYPAGFNRYGMADPFAWRNIRYPEVAIAAPVSRRWSMSAGVRAYWLADRKDALYQQGEEEVAHVSNATSTWVGNHLHVSLAYRHSVRWRLAGGYARLQAGDYLRQAQLAGGANGVYGLILYSR